MVMNHLLYEVQILSGLRSDMRDSKAHEKVMFCIFKDHIDGLILENDLLESHDILVRYLPI